ncbi:MAG: hypothetical protein Q7N87_03695 [Candidatus Uhrbacteria bacterium]|nr:hypothetical protein [Candidatus Uhrbacteria bacterium]
MSLHFYKNPKHAAAGLGIVLMGAGIVFSGAEIQNSPMFQQIVAPIQSESIFAAAKRILVRPAPKKAVTKSAVTLLEIVAGEDRSCFLTSQNTVWCWGEGNPVPNQINDASGVALKNVTHISAGTKHICASTGDGRAWCWGSNERGQLGNGTKIESDSAVQVKASADVSLAGVKTISAGGEHACALKNDGKVLCWGNNSDTELGNGSDQDSDLPVEVKEEGAGALSNIVSISSGSSFSCGLKNNGKVWCWGQLVAPSAVSEEETSATDNQDDESESESVSETTETLSAATPIEDENGAPILDVVSLGVFGSAKHLCVLKKDGTPWCFGGNEEGQFSEQKIDSLEAVAAFEKVPLTAVTGGDAHTCVIKKNGSVWCRGSNASGQLGNGGTAEKSGLTEVKDTTGKALTNATAIASGAKHTCVIKTGNEIWCWGDNPFQQTRTGKVVVPRAEQIVLPPGINTPSPVTTGPPLPSLTVGEGHGCVTRNPEGHVWCWGGVKLVVQQEESSSSTKSKIPITLSTAYPILEKNGQRFKGAVSISAGSNFACALKNDGSVWCWGILYFDQNNNQRGQLGDGTTNMSLTPVQVLVKQGIPLTRIKAISAGDSHVCALKNDGSAWCWGHNGGGALGNNSKESSSMAVPVSGKHIFTAISGGQGRTCAIGDKDSNLFCWGENPVWLGFGQGGNLGHTVLVPKVQNNKLGNPIKEVRTLARQPTADRFVAFQKDDLGVRDDSLWGMGTIPPGRDVGGPNIFNVFEELGQFVDSNNKPILVKLASTGGGVSGHSCVLNKSDHTASCWGSNNYGSLGDGTNAHRQFPTPVQDPQGGAFTDFYQIEVGTYHTCALGSRRGEEALEVWCWGYNAEGQLGDGTTKNSSFPVKVKF